MSEVYLHEIGTIFWMLFKSFPFCFLFSVFSVILVHGKTAPPKIVYSFKSPDEQIAVSNVSKVYLEGAQRALEKEVV